MTNEARHNHNIIEVRDLKKVYRLGKTRVEALKGVSLTIKRGEFVAIMGASGSGKSTFLNLIGCLDRPTSGTYYLDGYPVASCTDDELADIRSQKIGFVFQSFNLLPRATARENVELPLFYLRNGHKVQPDHPLKLLGIVGLPDRATHRPSELSGGEQQRVALARALANSPAIILADEPTGNLDSVRGKEIMEMLSRMNSSGITVVLVTHEEDIAGYARRIVRFKDGSIISDQKKEEIEISSEGPERIKPESKFYIDQKKGSFLNKLIPSLPEVWEHLRASFRSLWQNRLRSLLTTLGILIGVTAVIAMVSVGQGAQQDIRSRIEGLGTNLLTVIPGSSRTGIARGGTGSAPTLTMADAEAIRNTIPEITGVAPEISARFQVKYNRNNWRTNVVGTTPDYLLVRKWNLSAGSFFTVADLNMRKNVCVIGQDIILNLFDSGDPLGKTIRINNFPFRVIGILEPRGGGGFGSRDDIILIPVTIAIRRVTGDDKLNSISISVSSKEKMEEVREQTATLLRYLHRLLPGVEDDFTIISQEDLLQTMEGVSATLTILLASIAGISLLVGGIGIMNIMLVSVTERTREIGIRKAIGARRKDIMAQFLTEAVLLSLTGGFAGWLLGAAASRMITAVGNITTIITPGTVILALGFSVAVGIFFGIYPARKASRLDPIQALRYE